MDIGGIRRPRMTSSCSCSSNLVFYMGAAVLHLLFAHTATSLPIHVGYFGPEDGILTREYWSAFGVALTEANRTAPAGVSFSYTRVWTSSVDAANCSSSAQQLISENVEVVVSTTGSFCTAAALPLLASSGVAVIAAKATSDSLLSGAAGSDVLFRLSPSDTTQGHALASILDFFNWTSMSYVSVNTYNGSDIVTGLRSAALGSKVAFGVQLSVPSNASNVAARLDESFAEVKGTGTGINLLDVGDASSSEVAYARIFRDLSIDRVTGRGWQWIASGAAAVALQQTPIGDPARLYMQGTLAMVPLYANLSSELWMNYTAILSSEHTFSSGLATCSVLPGSGTVNLPFRGQVADSVLLIERAATLLSANASLLQGTTSVRRNAMQYHLSRIDSAANAIRSSSGNPLYFTSDRQAANPSLQIVSFDGNTWAAVGTWDTSGGFAIGDAFLWPGFSTEIPSELAPGFRPRFKIGFLYLNISSGNNTQVSQDNTLGREYLSAFNVSILHLAQNSSARVYFEAYTRGVGTDEECAQAAEELAQDVHIVIGGYRSNCTIAAAEVLGRRDVNVSQISYGSTVETLSDTSLYPWFLRVVPPDSFQGTALAELTQRFGWNKVALLYTENNIYAEGLRTSFQRASNGSLLNSTQITVIRGMPTDINSIPDADKIIDEALQEIVKQNTQVVLLVVYSGLAERIVVRGSLPGGPRPADGWIWVGTDSSTAFEPTKEEVRNAVTGMVGTRPKGGQGFVYLRLLSEWLQLNRTTNPGNVFGISATPQPYVPELFDAFSAVELALSDLVESKRLSQLSSVRTVRNMVFDQLLSYNSAENGFFGAIGSTIFFDDQRNGPAEYDIVNFQGGQWRKVGDWIRGRQDGAKLNLELLTVLPSGSIAMERASPPTFEILYVSQVQGAGADLSEQLALVRSIALQYLENNQRTYTIRLELTILTPNGTTSDCGSIVSSAVAERGNRTDRFGYVAILGLLQSACSISVSNRLKADGINIPLISFGSTSTELSNKTNHPNFFRTCPGDNNQAAVARDLVIRYNWTKIGIIGTSDPYGSGLANSVYQAILSLGTVVPAKPILFPPNSKFSVVLENIQKLRAGNTAVNYISAFTGDTRTVLLAAEMNNMLSEGWTWLGGDGMTALQFDSSNQVAVQSLVGSSLIIGNGSVFDFLSTRYTNQATKQNLVPRNNVVFPNGRSVSVPSFAAQLFDSITVLAYSMSQLWNSSEIRNIQFDINSVDRGQWLAATRMSIIKRLRNNTNPPSFFGAIGLPVTFTAEQDGPAAYNILNYFGSQWQVVGEHVNRTNSSRFLTIDRDIVWSGGVVEAHGSEPPTDPASSSARNEIIAFVIIGVVLACGVGLLLYHAVRKTRGADGMTTFSPVT